MYSVYLKYQVVPGTGAGTHFKIKRLRILNTLLYLYSRPLIDRPTTGTMTNEAAETGEAPTATEEEIIVDEQDHEKETDPDEDEDEDVFCTPVAAPPPPPPPPPTRTTTSSSSSSSRSRTGETTTITITSKVKCRHCARPARKGTV